MDKDNLKIPFSKYKRKTNTPDKIPKGINKKNTEKVKKETNTTSLIFLLGNNIRTIRKIKGCTIDELAEKAKISSTYLQLIEKNGRNVSMKKMDSIARALDVPAAILLSKNIDSHRKLFESDSTLKNHSNKGPIEK